MRRSMMQAQRNGEVTVCILHASDAHNGRTSNDNTGSTTALIARGKLVEPLHVIAQRLAVQATAQSPLQLVDAQGLCVDGALRAGSVYYVALCAGSDADEEEHATRAAAASAAAACAVLWAYDERMAHMHVPPDAQRTPETPYRLQRVMQALRECSRAHALLPHALQQQQDGAATHNAARLLLARMATRDEVLAWHDAATYGEFVEHGTPLASHGLATDVYCTDTSSAAARLAAGAVIDAAYAVWREVQQVREQTEAEAYSTEEDNMARQHALLALCLVRPPGHHCMRDAPHGFCLLNNVALATAALRRQAAPGVCRVAIVDLDVHFGDGTASYVEDVSRAHHQHNSAPDIGDDTGVLYVSMHRYDDGTFYPRDARAATAHTAGGCLCNIAVDTHAHDATHCTAVVSDYLMDAVVTRVIVPRLTRFAPDVVLVSLGLDAAYGDPLGKQAVDGGYARAMRTLRRWCLHDAPRKPVGLVAALEGGYCAASLAHAVIGVAHALTLPDDDVDVERYCALRPPQTWRDVRTRLQRDAAATSGDASALADEATLLQQHLQWCDDVVAHARRVHKLD